MRKLLLILLVALGLFGSALVYVHVRVSRLLALHTTLDLTAGPTGTTLPGQPSAAGSPATSSPSSGTPTAGGPGLGAPAAGAPTPAPGGSGGPLWRVETPAGDFLEVTGITPAPGSTLALKDKVTVEFRFGLTSIGQCMVYAKPLAKGKRVTKGGSNLGSPVMPGPRGNGSFEFRFSAPAECDALEVFMEIGDILPMLYAYRVLDQDLHLLTLRLPCPLTWK
ncbi:MAG: hypothetical protein GX442_21195 [Candidatus Riflebacteria bacterium]|nr:hypothetical protein [Candidatus Riflebacteria bacterium]